MSRLHVAETISLGQKRFVAVIQIDGLRFLVGGGATNVALLAQLNPMESFGGMLTEKTNAPKTKTAKRTGKHVAKAKLELMANHDLAPTLRLKMKQIAKPTLEPAKQNPNPAGNLTGKQIAKPTVMLTREQM